MSENVKHYSLDRVRAMLVDEFCYTIEGRPVSWQRTNVVRGRPMTDRKQREAKKVHAWTAAASMRSAAPSWALDGAFEVEVAAYYPDSRQGDADRLAGVPLDALEGIAYHADRQVKRLRVEVNVDRARPRTEVVVRRLHVERVPCTILAVSGGEWCLLTPGSTTSGRATTVDTRLGVCDAAVFAADMNHAPLIVVAKTLGKWVNMLAGWRTVIAPRSLPAGAVPIARWAETSAEVADVARRAMG